MELTAPNLPTSSQPTPSETKFSAWPVEKKQLARLARNCPGHYVIEIGCFQGLTSLHLARVVEETGKHLICIDPWDLTQDQSDDTIYQSFLKRTAPMKHVMTVIREHSERAVPLLPADAPGNIALVFVDGDHTYPAPLHDVQLYYPLLSAGGAIAMHDVFDEYWGPHSMRSIKEFAPARHVEMLYYRPSEAEIAAYEHKESGLAWFYKKEDAAS